MYAACQQQGAGAALYRPDDLIDHQQYLTILARLAKRLSMKFDPQVADSPDEAASQALLGYAPWAREGVWLLDGSQKTPLGEDLSLLWSDRAHIVPTAPTTRAEAAAGLYRLLDYTGILPG